MAVLPFRNNSVSAGPGIALGMAEEISAALARSGLPRLVATASFWDGTGPVADARSICRTHQLDYVIDGTIHASGNDITVEVTLMDVVLDFDVVWHGRFDGTFDDLFSLQHRIAFETVRHVDPDLSHGSAEAIAPIRTEIAEAHQCVLRAIQGIFRLDRQTFIGARDYLLRAIDLDDEYAAAHAWLAYWSLIAAGYGWLENPRAVMELAGTAASRAIELDPFDARAAAIAGHVRAYLFHDVPHALELVARAIELDPNLPIAWTMSSWSRIYNGEHVVAVRHAMMAQSLSPRDPHIWLAEHSFATAQLFSRNLEEADAMAALVLERNPNHVSALNSRLAILGHLGHVEAAGHYLAILRSFDPHVNVARIASRMPLRPADKGFYMEGLERAGVPRS